MPSEGYHGFGTFNEPHFGGFMKWGNPIERFRESWWPNGMFSPIKFVGGILWWAWHSHRKKTIALMVTAGAFHIRKVMKRRQKRYWSLILLKLTLTIPTFRTSSYKNSYLSQVVMLWKSLPRSSLQLVDVKAEMF